MPPEWEVNNAGKSNSPLPFTTPVSGSNVAPIQRCKNVQMCEECTVQNLLNKELLIYHYPAVAQQQMISIVELSLLEGRTLFCHIQMQSLAEAGEQ